MIIDLTWHHLPIDVSWDGDYVKMLCGDFPAATQGDADRIVYVIRLKRPCYVSYLKDKSPVCYIGSGRGWRIFAHREGWLAKMPLLLDDFLGFDICLAKPRRKGPGNIEAYKVVEADLISIFKKRFGERPLFNRRLGATSPKFDYDHSEDVFGLGRGPGYRVKVKSMQTRKSEILASAKEH